MSSAPKPIPPDESGRPSSEHQSGDSSSDLTLPAFGAPLVAIVGPTASGKSALAVEMAQRFGAEVLACDSTQVYRGVDIGTAKPTRDERKGIPHHLLDLVDPSYHFTAGEYRVRAIAVLEDLGRRSKLPILTVGTGLYLRALLEGLADAPARSEELRERLEALAEARNLNYLHRLLGKLDPEAAARIGRRDRQKLIRAIEICLLSGRSVTEVHQAGREGLTGFATIKIGLQPPRSELYDHIERRARVMIASGWLDEVAGLLRQGLPADAKPFDFIGYSELRAHLEGTVTLSAAVKAISHATRRYAKRQLTWFRKEPHVHWLPGFGADPGVLDAAEQLIAGHLNQIAAAHGAA